MAITSQDKEVGHCWCKKSRNFF